MNYWSLSIFAVLFGLIGCAVNSATTSNSSGSTANVTGNWVLTVTSTQSPYMGSVVPVGIYLTAAGNSVSGTAAISVACPAFGCGWPTLLLNRALSGTIDADGNIKLTSTGTNGVFALTAKYTGTSLENGTYTLTNGSVVDQGTVSGEMYPLLNGTYSGTVVSSVTGQSIGVTTTLSQSTTPSSRGYQDVIGSAAVTGESCFSAATMAGPADLASGFAGNYFAVTLVTTNNPSIFINESGTLSQDGKTIQFTYSVVNINGGSGCDNNDLARGTLTLK